MGDQTGITALGVGRRSKLNTLVTCMISILGISIAVVIWIVGGYIWIVGHSPIGLLIGIIGSYLFVQALNDRVKGDEDGAEDVRES